MQCWRRLESTILTEITLILELHAVNTTGSAALALLIQVIRTSLKLSLAISEISLRSFSYFVLGIQCGQQNSF
ncbi:60S ribosomal protein L30 [Iris pallida]|uniref:60S ribosomal protein L30 n=1 Tax=Iris pallida TaxID=29817 RepID=A0AAX6DG64_IRIPA|nr:60S ribosomal protein L30 [Iris pallida]